MSRYDVDLIINCYEKTYRKVLDPDFIKNIIDRNRFSFKNVFVVIGNVSDRMAVSKLAEKIVRKKVINDFYFVEDHIETALKKVGLKKKELGRIPWYSDWEYVMLQVCRSEYFLHWDSDIALAKKTDWISPSIIEMERETSYFTACPAWTKNLDDCRKESFQETGDFLIGYGFSDQIYLGRKADFYRPIYRYFHLMSLRYLLVYINRIYESRVDSYMRTHSKFRIVYKKAVYIHPDSKEMSHPKKISLWERTKKWLMRRVFLIYITIRKNV